MPEHPYLQWPVFRRSVVAAFQRSLTSRVRSVRAGFAGPATGEEHVRLKQELRELVERLVAERAQAS